MQTWPRREHFELFRKYEYPQFSLCANVEITAFRNYVKETGISFHIAVVYLLARTANQIPEFRYRIRGDAVIEHDIVHPSSTIMGNDGVFSFCSLQYVDDFATFARESAIKIADVQQRPRLSEEDKDRDDLLFMTVVPWVSFTGFMHPMRLDPSDSVPRIAWGKYFEEGERIKMPLGVQGHHALMDGLHAGRYYEIAQEYFHHPETILGAI
ncbi:MAG: chloramphenicol acetyltransferase [Anaerolineaceae bacterium]